MTWPIVLSIELIKPTGYLSDGHRKTIKVRKDDGYETLHGKHRDDKHAGAHGNLRNDFRLKQNLLNGKSF